MPESIADLRIVDLLDVLLVAGVVWAGLRWLRARARLVLIGLVSLIATTLLVRQREKVAEWALVTVVDPDEITRILVRLAPRVVGPRHQAAVLEQVCGGLGGAVAGVGHHRHLAGPDGPRAGGQVGEHGALAGGHGCAPLDQLSGGRSREPIRSLGATQGAA